LNTDVKYSLKVFQTVHDLNLAAAELIVAIASEAIAARDRFTIALSGGQTPEKLYSLLGESPWRQQIDWINTFIFWGDERYVLFDSVKNNAHQAKSLLFDKIDIPASNVHVIPVHLLPSEVAREYEKTLEGFFQSDSMRFDLVLLGLGTNGHTASLFPGTPVLNEQIAGVRPVYVIEEEMYRITMTAPLINQARHIFFLVTGVNKREILRHVLGDSYQPKKYPAQLIAPTHGEVTWLVDQAAAESMTPRNN